MDRTAPVKLRQAQKQNTPLERANQNHKWTNCQSYTKMSQKAINLTIAISMRFCMADELNGQALSIHHTNPYINYNSQNGGTSRYFGQ